MTGQSVTNEQYQHAKNVWEAFGMEKMRDYLETYCLSDTLQLCEVFERFRIESLTHFEIDPCHFVSLPGFSYQYFLKNTRVELDYIYHEQLYSMISENIRGGHSFASSRYCEATLFNSKTENSKKQFIIDIGKKSFHF